MVDKPEGTEANTEQAQEAARPKQTNARLQLLEEQVDLLLVDMKDVKARVANVPKRGLFGGKRARTPVKDTKTGMVYLSKSHCGQQLCEEANTDPTDHFAFYKLQNAFPDRFVEATEEEAKAAEEFWKGEEEEAPAEA